MIIRGDFNEGEPVNGDIITQGLQTYTGPISNWMPNGDGIVVLQNGNSFSAYFKNSIIDSNGILKIKNEGITITGNFVDYKPHGTVKI